MKSVKEIIDDHVSNYTGSLVTRDMVKKQIARRWGKEEAELYNPDKDALPFVAWSRLGYRIKPGEKALRSITFVEVKDKKGEVVRRIPRPVYLFYYLQVRKVGY